MVLKYFVVLREGAWEIKHNGDHSARYRSKTEAIQDAVAAACKARKCSQDAQVIVQGEDLLFRTEWAYYGHDPYLPAAKGTHPPRQLAKKARSLSRG
jgi:hypothetical protein